MALNTPWKSLNSHININLPEENSIDPLEMRKSYLYQILCDSSLLALEGIDPKAAGSCDPDPHLNLGSVYTALLTLERKEGTKGFKDFDLKETTAQSALGVINEHRHVVLLGDPGSGKTTFVNFLTCCMAGELYGEETVNLSRLTRPLPDDKGKDREEPQPWNLGALLPVRVVLRDFAARRLSGTDVSAADLWEFIEGELEKSVLDGYGPHLKRELQEKGGILLLDGLDEVPEAENRRMQIRKVVEGFIKSFRKCRVVVTSRTYAYHQQEWRIPGLHEAVLAPFSEGQMRRFIDQWYAHVARLRYKNSDEAEGNAHLLKQAIFRNSRLKSLAERPLLLTLMASLHSWRGGTLPENREELYADTVDLLLDRWERPKAVKDGTGKFSLVQPGLLEWLKIDRAQMRTLLNRLAYNAHAGQEKLTGTADIPEKDLVHGLYEICENPKADIQKLMDFLRDRTGLLVPRGVKVYSFPHRTFQEYLAACHLTDDEYPDSVAELSRKDPDRWREVCLLAGAKAAGGSKSSVWGLVQALCFREIGNAEADAQDLWGALLAGQVLVESGIYGQPSAKNKVNLERVKTWLLHILKGDDLPALERVNAGNALAVLGDPRFDKDYWYLPDDGMLGFVKIPEGSFYMGSDKGKDPEANGDEQPQHEVYLSEYWMGRYPVTVGQYRAFLTDTGQKSTAEWERWNRVSTHPVVMVSWEGAFAYCTWLTDKLKFTENLPGDLKEIGRTHDLKVSLPTEAQWEKAARGNDGRIYPCGNELNPDTANYVETGLGDTSPVGCFPMDTSPYYIREMTGNVWEWCLDDLRKYSTKRCVDPKGPQEKDSVRVIRGGCWGGPAGYCRAAFRYGGVPGFRDLLLGFRLVLPGQPQDRQARVPGVSRESRA